MTAVDPDIQFSTYDGTPESAQRILETVLEVQPGNSLVKTTAGILQISPKTLEALRRRYSEPIDLPAFMRSFLRP